MKIKLSKSQWEEMGKKAGWMVISSNKNHRIFDNKKDALSFLSDHGLMSVGWKEGKYMMEACYWNGKVYITKSNVEHSDINVAKKASISKTAGEDWMVNESYTKQIADELTRRGDKVISSVSHQVIVNHRIQGKILNGLLVEVFEGSYEGDFTLIPKNAATKRQLGLVDGKTAAEAIDNMDKQLGMVIASIEESKPSKNANKKDNLTKTSETISARDLYNKYLQEGKQKQEAAEIVLDILTDGAFVSIEEPKRTEMINKVIEKFSDSKDVQRREFSTNSVNDKSKTESVKATFNDGDVIDTKK